MAFVDYPDTDKGPFFAATYIPKETRFGRIGMLTIIRRIKELWSTRKAEALSSAAQVVSALKGSASAAPGEGINESLLHLARKQLSERFDEQQGGFSNSPKFPTPHNLFSLLRYWKRTGDDKSLVMVEKTLQAMTCGGIYDHVGFGFHRYSTDSNWLVAHFEKMLYDQAMLAIAYAETYQVTKKEEYAQTAKNRYIYLHWRRGRVELHLK
jgi:uncharacterized protein YyaL (SSP411 family)